MALVNEGSIQRKLLGALNSDKIREKLHAVSKQAAIDAAIRFIVLLNRTVEMRLREYLQVQYGSRNRGDSTAWSVLRSASYKMPEVHSVNVGSDRSVPHDEAVIDISFAQDLHRPSLFPESYAGVDNIVDLLNHGYSASGTVYGVWRGERIRSLRTRPGMEFIEQTLDQFMSMYAKDYHVTGIVVNDTYHIDNR